MHQLSLLAALLGTTLAQAPNTRTVFQFPKPTWLENIATTRTGHLLTSVLNRAPAELHIVDPSAIYNASTANATLLHAFPGVNTVFGISEYAPDLFAVAVGNYSPATGATKGTYAVWSVDVSSLASSSSSSAKPTSKVRKLASLPNASVINGIAALNKDAILIADSFAGSILRLDISSGRTHTAINDSTTAFASPLGVNGVKVSHATDPPTLYYTNSGLNATFAAPVDPRSGNLVGKPVIVAANEATPDDLAVTDDGTAFFARPYAGTLTRARAGVEAVIVAGAEGSMELGGATSATLGRAWGDRGVVYVATMGGFDSEGGYAEGGKIVAVNVGR
ncbi:hypothetical protein DPSP01_003382 [Paraphaeosphaeria sporulosa]|uniref:SMP-30/Gluconolactonase/LRE-like region domain-containing protein n=1 Tax=Paraphaeosphaeria sporulosa TaxID=1460663 RepID=A0A177CBV1_9PLEO|nr:uncharacterized protein CC84DRAFT_1165469 [Paraphaeosphaeria sporulosa]OAG05144.1 hypothetical protein CC84DRAFT_1165469 [Paraphaeosphaeria sporulosa]